MPKAIREAGPLTLAPTPAATKGAIPIVLISPGWGSSGYYSADVLKNAAEAGVFGKGLQLFLDHPGEAETYDRPERSVRDLAATLAEDATWDPNLGIVGEAVPFGAAADMLADKDFAEAIGVSIRAYADSTIGEAEGRKGQIITDIVEAISADFVTRAGRGGRVLVELMESARPGQVIERAVANGVQEATANDTRAALDTALRDAYAGEKSWVWVRDFDETNVWFTHESPDGMATYQDSYELDGDGVVTLSGSPVEVRAKTVYVPVKPATESGAPSVPAPAGQSITTEESQEDTMPQIEEARLRQLEEDAGRVQTLESERDQAARERDEAREALAAERRTAAAGRIIDAAEASFTALERRGLLADLPVTESGDLDEAAYTTTVTEAAAEKAQASGAGSVRGFGAAPTPQDTDAIKAAESAAAAAFGRQVKEA